MEKHLIAYNSTEIFDRIATTVLPRSLLAPEY